MTLLQKVKMYFRSQTILEVFMTETHATSSFRSLALYFCSSTSEPHCLPVSPIHFCVLSTEFHACFTEADYVAVCGLETKAISQPTDFPEWHTGLWSARQPVTSCVFIVAFARQPVLCDPGSGLSISPFVPQMTNTLDWLYWLLIWNGWVWTAILLR